LVCFTYVGTTRYISSGDLQFILNHALDPGTTIKFTIQLGAELADGASVFIHGNGKVLSVDAFHESSFQITAVIERHEISRYNTAGVSEFL
jgi:hypothetical protein